MELFTNDAMQSNLGFVTAQTAHVETEVYRHRYPEIRYPGLIPVDYSAPPWAKSVDYYSMDIAGVAGWTADRASDINVVGMQLGKSSSTVHMADIGYDYGLEEVNQANMLGMNLSSEKASAARTIYERTVDNIAFNGDATKGWTGLFNSDQVASEGVTTGGWGTNVEEDLILADINEVITGVFVGTNEVAIADTVLMPSTSYQYIASTRLGDTGITILEFIRRANAYTAETGQPLNIRGMRGLETAGTGSTKRLVAYRNNRQVLKMHIPMRHQFLPVQIVGLTFKIPGIFRLGGLDIRLPREVRYGDGI